MAKEIGEPLTDDYLREMLEDADRDGDGEINEAEFMRIMRRVEDFEWVYFLQNLRIPRYQNG